MSSFPSPAMRPLRHTDAPQVLRAFESDPLMSRQGTVGDLAQAQRYTARLVDDPAQQAFAITVADRLVGLVCASVDEANASGWFWYWVDAGQRSRHLCSRAAATLANHLLGAARLHRLELGARANNPASLKVARAAGFIQEGVEREKFLMDGHRVDVLGFGRLATDPFPDTEPLALHVPDDAPAGG